MNPQQAENLRILIRHMETKCERTLNMGTVGDCGTPACALGEAKFVAMQAQFAPFGDENAFRAVEHIFGLHSVVTSRPREDFNSRHSAYRIFGCSINGEHLVKPKDWAIEARKLLAEHGYTMDDGFAAFKAKILAPLDNAIA